MSQYLLKKVTPPLITYSIIIPVFNASSTLPHLLEDVLEELTTIIQEVELIFVEDGSTDDSWQILQTLQNQYANIHISLFKLSKNYGQAAATLCGIEHAQGQCLITFDDDLQYDASDILNIIRFFHQHESQYLVIYGQPIRKKQNRLHRYSAQLTAWYQFRLLLRQPTRSSLSTSFRIFNHQLSRTITGNYLVDIDSCINWYVPETKVGFLPVQHYKRKYGQSGYTFWKKAKIVFDYTLYFFSPLPLFTFLGILLTGYTLLLCLLSCWGQPSFPHPFLYLFCIAFLFLGIGILGNYVAKIYLLSLGKKPYILEKELLHTAFNISPQSIK